MKDGHDNKYLYGKYEDEILSMPEEEYDKLFYCPNCGETNRDHFDRFPSKYEYNPQGIGNFMTFRCLSCGRFCSLSTNYEKRYLIGKH